MRLMAKISLTFLLAGSAVFGQTGGTNIPESWSQQSRGFIPHHAKVSGWSSPLAKPTPWVAPGVKPPDSNRMAVRFMRWDPTRDHDPDLPTYRVEVPAGESLKVRLETAKDAPMELSVTSDATWKLGMRFSRAEQGFVNRGREPRQAQISLIPTAHWGKVFYYATERDAASGTPIAVSTDITDHLSGRKIERRPWVIRLDRSWDIEAWRAKRQLTAPDPQTLPEADPAGLSLRFAPPLSVLDVALAQSAEVTLLVDAQGRPWAVHPGVGDPGQVAKLVDWAWQLAFEPGKGLPATGGVKVPLRVNRPL